MTCLPRLRRQILETVVKLREQGWEYRLEASFIEVYNEALRCVHGWGCMTVPSPALRAACHARPHVPSAPPPHRPTTCSFRSPTPSLA